LSASGARPMLSTCPARLLGWMESDMAVLRSRGGISAWWRICPSQPGRMSGDWIDVVDLADGRVALAIGDAAGHDDQASALALVLRSLMHRRLRAGADPADVVSGALDEITELGDMGERFATAFVAIAEPDGTVIYANAG